MVNLEFNREHPSNDSLDVLVDTRFSSGRAGPGISAVVLNNEQYRVCDIKDYGPKMQHIMFQSQPFILQFCQVRHCKMSTALSGYSKVILSFLAPRR